MPIKAKYNGSYKDITDLMNVDESIDYVLAKTSSSYKRVYTATRSIEDAPPTTFKSIKPGANLTDYSIYGNTSKNILPLSKTPKTETIGDILCEYDGKGTFTFTSNVDNPTYTQDQWFWVPFEEDFDFPVGISDGGHGCIQLNNDFATGYGVTPYFVGFANRDNGEFVSGFNVAGSALNIVDTNYYTEDLEGLPANCIAFQYLQQIGKRTVTIKPALYLDIRTQQPFEPYGESVGDRTANLWNGVLIDGVYTDNTLNNVGLATGVFKSLSVYLNAGTYTLSFSTNVNVVRYVEKDVLYTENLAINVSSYTFTLSNATSIGFSFRDTASSTTQWDNNINVMLNEGVTPLPYEPYGYKVPVTVEGKNLLQNTGTSQTVNGVEFTINANGSVTCNEQATSAIYFKINSRFTLPVGEFVLTGCPTGGGNSSYRMYIQSHNLSPQKYYTDTGNGVTIDNTNADTVYSARISIVSGYSCNNLTFYPMIRKADIEDDTYEPYHAPITTPIYLPEQIRKVGDEAEYISYAEQKQHRVRKNLFNETIYNKNVENNTLIYVPIYVGNVDYVTCSTTCPKTIYSGNDSDNSRYIFIFSGNVNTGAKNAINGVSNGAPRTIQPSDGYVTIAYRKIENFNVRPWEYQTMLNSGSTPLPYEPYIENTDLDVTLPALPTLTGTNVLSVGTEVQPSKIDITGHIKTISGGS